MRFYESGDKDRPVIFLFPGTCCLYNSFDHVLEGLHSYFYTVVVSYDGFEPNEKTEFSSMEAECVKIEQEIQEKYNGKIKAAYGCSLGGSFVSLLIQRKKIHIEHGITGSSDMDEAGPLMAKIQAHIVVPIMYKMLQTGTLPNHVFYATKMGEKYEQRYLTYFKNPDIRRHDMQHEELFCSHVEEWVEEVRKSCGME